MARDIPVTHIIQALEQDDLLPAILFRTSRKQCDQDVLQLAEVRATRIPTEQRDEIAAAVDAVIAKYNFEEDVIKEHPQFASLLESGAGAHHAGQLLHWRLMLEELMAANLLRMLIATGTVAAGVDFPARSVIITAHSKRGADGFQTLTNTEFQQMSGRAGRRGKDAVGFCLVAPGPFSDARVIHEIADKPPEPLRSAYFAAPSTVLNLLKFRNVDDLRYTVHKSLAAFLDRKAALRAREEADGEELIAESEADIAESSRKKLAKRIRRRRAEADLLEQRQERQLDSALAGLERLKHLDERGLTKKGEWAAELCTNLVLELAEAIHEGLFFDCSLEESVALVASIAGDPYRSYFSIARNPIDKKLFQEMEVVVERVAKAYRAPTNASEVAVLPDAALTVLTWMDSENWSAFASLLKLAGVAAGDAARLIMQTADHFNQIGRLRDTHPDLVRIADEARARLLRPPLSDAFIVDTDEASS